MLVIKLLDKKCKPEKKKTGDVGFDLRNRSGNTWFFPFQRKKMLTGVCAQIPYGFSGDIRPRSGNSLRGFDVKLGTIDNNYRGEIGVVLKNDSFKIRKINQYERIAQLVLVQVSLYDNNNITIVDELDQTDRGEDGFGASGKL